jgi:hypothetical protein
MPLAAQAGAYNGASLWFGCGTGDYEGHGRGNPGAEAYYDREWVQVRQGDSRSFLMVAQVYTPDHTDEVGEPRSGWFYIRRPSRYIDAGIRIVDAETRTVSLVPDQALLLKVEPAVDRFDRVLIRVDIETSKTEGKRNTEGRNEVRLIAYADGIGEVARTSVDLNRARRGNAAALDTSDQGVAFTPALGVRTSGDGYVPETYLADLRVQQINEGAAYRLLDARSVPLSTPPALASKTPAGSDHRAISLPMEKRAPTTSAHVDDSRPRLARGADRSMPPLSRTPPATRAELPIAPTAATTRFTARPARPGRPARSAGALTVSRVGIVSRGTRHAAATASVARVAQRIVIAIDTSSSMRPYIDRARAAATEALLALKPGDSFVVLDCAAEVRPYRAEWTQATPEAVRTALDWVRGLQVTSGTNISGTLERAFGFPEVGRLLLITDGGAASRGIVDEKQLLQFAHDRNTGGTRIDVVLVVQAPTDNIASRLAEESHGLTHFRLRIP